MISKRWNNALIKSLLPKNDLKAFATKDNLKAMEKRLKKEIVEDVVYYLQENILPLLNEYGKRLDRLEKRVGGFPALA